MGASADKTLSLRIFKSNPPGAVAVGAGIDGRLRLCTGYLGIIGFKRTRCIVENAPEGFWLVISRWGMPMAKIDGNRSGCQNITLVITSSDGVPCAHGHAPLIATGTLGTDSA
jgi:hypothetical protein